MYSITKQKSGRWFCTVQIQDGIEGWEKPTRQEAIQSVIQTARVLNGTYITELDIEISRDVLDDTSLGPETQLLQDISRGAKVVLDARDPRVLYNITREDCELIVKIREGDVLLTYR